MDYLPEFIDVLKSMDMWEGDKMYDSIDFSTDFVGIEMFKTKSFKENVDRKLINTINGKKGGRKWEIVTLRNLETGELKAFKCRKTTIGQPYGCPIMISNCLIYKKILY